MAHLIRTSASRLYFRTISGLLSIPHPGDLSLSHLLLQLENSIKQSLCCWRASWNIYIDWNNTIHASHYRVAVMVISSTVCTAAHANHPPRVWHLVVAHSKSRSHLVRKCACNDHDICLSGRSAEYDAKTVLIVSRH